MPSVSSPVYITTTTDEGLIEVAGITEGFAYCWSLAFDIADGAHMGRGG
jgi:hypothetical protein